MNDRAGTQASLPDAAAGWRVRHALWGACTAGLGNRLLMLAGCLRIARLCRRRFALYWPVNEWLGCPFDRLLANHVELIAETDLHRLLLTNNSVKVYNAWADRPGPHFTRLAADGDPDADIVVVKGWDHPLLEGETEDKAFRSEIRRILSDLRAVPSVEEEIKSFQLPEQTIGVHIRRGDNPERFGRSQDNHFRAILSAVIAASPHTRFFLATDCAETERSFMSRFGERILVFPKTGGGRATERGAQEAWIDLQLLSRTRAIIGNLHSSFSRLAGLWRNRLVLRADETSAALRLDVSVNRLLRGF